MRIQQGLHSPGIIYLFEKFRRRRRETQSSQSRIKSSKENTKQKLEKQQYDTWYIWSQHTTMNLLCCWLLLLLLLFLKGRWACIVITGPSLKRIGQPNKRDTQLKSLYTHPSQWISWWFSFYCQVLNSISSFYFPHSSSSLISVVKRYRFLWILAVFE